MAIKAESKILDDIARVAGGAVSILSSIKDQVRSDLRDRVDMAASKMDIAPWDDLERLFGMVEKLRIEQEQIKKRIEQLEGTGKVKSAPRKNAVKKVKTTQPKKSGKR